MREPKASSYTARRGSSFDGPFRRRWRHRLAAAVVVLVCGTTVALGDEARDSTAVTFPSAEKFDPAQISAELFVPDGDGPFPALVLLHSRGGVGEHDHMWAARFRALGYLALIVDSLGSRGIDGDPKLPYFHRQTSDAYGALAFLQSHPLTDADRIAVVGWSHGGGTALRAARANAGAAQNNARRVGRFRAAIMFYPYCGVTDVFDIPLLILIGEADDWTPARMCETIARAAAQMGSPVAVDVVVYPGATHGFDAELNGDPAVVAAWAAEYPDIVAVPGGLRYLGHLIKYDAEATADAIARVEAFLAEHLGRNSGD